MEKRSRAAMRAEVASIVIVVEVGGRCGGFVICFVVL